MSKEHTHTSISLVPPNMFLEKKNVIKSSRNATVVDVVKVVDFYSFGYPRLNNLPYPLSLCGYGI